MDVVHHPSPDPGRSPVLLPHHHSIVMLLLVQLLQPPRETPAGWPPTSAARWHTTSRSLTQGQATYGARLKSTDARAASCIHPQRARALEIAFHFTRERYALLGTYVRLIIRQLLWTPPMQQALDTCAMRHDALRPGIGCLALCTAHCLVCVAVCVWVCVGGWVCVGWVWLGVGVVGGVYYPSSRVCTIQAATAAALAHTAAADGCIVLSMPHKAAHPQGTAMPPPRGGPPPPPPGSGPV